MRDPFRPNSNSQLVREAQFGLSLVAILLGLFVYVAFYKIKGYGRTIPDHVRNAPVAQMVWPHEPPQNEELASSDRDLLTRARRFLNDPFGDAREAESPPLAGKQPERRLPVPDPLKPEPAVQSTSFESTETVPPKLNLLPQVDPIPVDPIPVDPIPVEPIPFESDDSSPVLKVPKIVDSSPTKPGPDKSLVGNSDFQKFEANAKPAVVEIQPNLQSPRPIQTNALRGGDFAIAPVAKDDSETTERVSTSIKPMTPTIKENVNSPQQTYTASPAAIENDLLPSSGHITDSDLNNLQVKSVKIAEPEMTDDVRTRAEVSQVNTAAFHQVEAGESFWTIAQQHYDDGRYFHALYKYNEMIVADFDTLIPGTQIGTPLVEVLYQRWPELCPRQDIPVNFSNSENELHAAKPELPSSESGNFYETQAGDTLFGIAAQKLGQASRYLELLKLNESRIPVGTDHLSPLPGNIRLILP